MAPAARNPLTRGRMRRHLWPKRWLQQTQQEEPRGWMTHGPASTERGADDEVPVAKDVAAPAAMRGAEGTGSPISTH